MLYNYPIMDEEKIEQHSRSVSRTSAIGGAWAGYEIAKDLAHHIDAVPTGKVFAKTALYAGTIGSMAYACSVVGRVMFDTAMKR